MRLATRRLHDSIDRRVLSYLVVAIADGGRSPTVREIGHRCAIASTRSVQESLARLERAGAISTQLGRSRSIEVLRTDLALDTRARRALLLFFSVTAHGFYPFMCHAAALAPSTASAEGWLGLIAMRLRNLDAIDAALENVEPGDDGHRELVEDCWERYRGVLESLTSWAEWIALEEMSAHLVLARGFAVPGDLSSYANSVLEGQMDIAYQGAQYTRREIARMTALAGGAQEITDARQMIAEHCDPIDTLLDKIW